MSYSFKDVLLNSDDALSNIQMMEDLTQTAENTATRHELLVSPAY